MSKVIKCEELTYKLRKELELYHAEVVEEINHAGEQTVKAIVKKTKATAPVMTGDFQKNITWSEQVGKFMGKRYIWHVKAPDYRITHLLVHGHATPTGGRTKPDPFLQNALDQELPAYEKKVKEALKR